MTEVICYIKSVKYEIWADDLLSAASHVILFHKQLFYNNTRLKIGNNLQHVSKILRLRSGSQIYSNIAANFEADFHVALKNLELYRKKACMYLNK